MARKQEDYRRLKLWKLIKNKSYKTGQFTLASGRESTFIFDLKPVMLDYVGAYYLGNMILDYVIDHNIRNIGGLEIGAIPLSISAMVLSNTKPLTGFYVRKEPKGHGISDMLIGELVAGPIMLVDDVTTTGHSLIKARDALGDRAPDVQHALSIVDREEGAVENLKHEGIELHSIFKAGDFM